MNKSAEAETSNPPQDQINAVVALYQSGQMAKDKSTRFFVAKAHKIIDIYFEGPLVPLSRLIPILSNVLMRNGPI